MKDQLAPVPPSASPLFLWNEIIRWTTEACILRKEGRERAVRELLDERLPELIRAWSARCGQSAERCREELRTLFLRIQEGVELGFVQRRILVAEITELLGRDPRGPRQPLLPEEASGRNRIGLRREVPIGDVPGMLDALAEAEFEAIGEAVLPMRSAMAASRALEPAGSRSSGMPVAPEIPVLSPTD